MIKIRQLDMELFGGCNYTCQMCPQGSKEGREHEFKKSLKWKNFVKIVDEAIEHGVEGISIHGGGEPTLHKNFIDCIKYIKNKNIKCITFSNGYTLNKKLCKDISTSGIDIFRLSMIGYNEKLYHKWMGANAFEKVRKNVKYLVEVCKETKTEIQSTHLIIDNDDRNYEIDQYKKWINHTNTLAEIWMMHNWSGNYNGNYTRSKKNMKNCNRPFLPSLHVRAGGLGKHQAAVVPCPFVLGSEIEATLGHLDTQTIEEVFNGEKYMELRNAHKEGRPEDISYCKNCDQLFEVPESLVWTNIKNRRYNESKLIDNFSFSN
jgi:pyruvate-formate lyase-activating enzyme